MKVLVTGGAGFVGSALVPALLARGHQVTVLDLFLFNYRPEAHPQLRVIQGDIRTLPTDLGRQDAVIHLACIANDPSWELDPALGKSVNYDALAPLVEWAKDAGVQRFIYASSSSVYGTKPEGLEVTEDLPLEWLTDYSKYKALGEDVVLARQSKDFTVTVLRPATICGYAPRVRLDVVVNQMTADALISGTISVHGGEQLRANLHIDDMARAYIAVLEAPADVVGGQVFNVGAENLRVLDIASRVMAIVPREDQYVKRAAPTNDPRSYTLNADKIARVLGFRPLHTVDEAIRELCAAFADGRVPNPTDDTYYNLKQMQRCLIS
jgi:nucleoside-diphosphate-sugar epimerase